MKVDRVHDGNYNEREFDTMLENAVPDLPPEDIVGGVTPWKRSMNRVLIGLALTMLTLNFFALNYILPIVGMLLMLIGFRTLRKENSWFSGCYAIIIIRSVYYFPMMILNATRFQQSFYNSDITFLLTIGNLILQFAMLLFLWQGIKAVQRKAEIDEHAGGAAGLLICFGVICVLALLQYNGIVIMLILLACYIFAIRSLWKLAEEMDQAGYMIEASPIRISDGVLTATIGGLLAIGLVLAYLFGGKYPMEWEPWEHPEDAEILAIKEELTALGFPEEILDDLSVADILECKGATRVAVCIREHAMNKGRQVTEIHKRSDSDAYVRNTTTVFDEKELRIVEIAVELPDEQEHWTLIHHFRFMSDPGYFGMDCIQLWPAYRASNRGWSKASDFTGQVLYCKDGVTYAAPYATLGEEAYTSHSPFFGQSANQDVFAEFSFPNDGEAQRGYISYTVKELQEGWLIDAWINYTHQQTWAQYPVVTAKEHRMTSDWGSGSVFKTAQDAIQFRPTEEELNLIDGD